MPTATMSSAAKAKNAFSRLGFFLVAATGGVDSRALSLAFVVVVDPEEDALFPDDFAPVRLDERDVDDVEGLAAAGAALVAIGAGSDDAGLLVGTADSAVAVEEEGFCGAEAVRARALRARISLRCARVGFLLTIRRYSKQVRSGKTPAL